MGKKATRAEHELRVTEIHNLIVSGCSRPMLLQHASKKWQCSTRQTDSYIARAYQLIQAESASSRELDRAVAKATMKEAMRGARTDHKWGEMIAAQREINKMFSLYDPPQPRVFSIVGLDEKELTALSNAIRSHGMQPSDIFLSMIQELALADGTSK